MEVKRGRCLKCGANYEITSDNYCPRCTAFKVSRNSSFSSLRNKTESARVHANPAELSYVMQIVSIGIRSDNVYEVLSYSVTGLDPPGSILPVTGFTCRQARMLLAPDADMASIKITVKGKNLRVSIRRPPNEALTRRLSEVTEKSVATDLMKKTAKHCENLLIPESIDGDKVRAVVDNKHRILILTAPTIKPSKARKKYMEKV